MGNRIRNFIRPDKQSYFVSEAGVPSCGCRPVRPSRPTRLALRLGPLAKPDRETKGLGPRRDVPGRDRQAGSEAEG